jgi:hypothetical protein
MKQTKAIPLTRKQVVASRFLLRVLGISVLLAFLGTILTVAKSVGHLVYPAWIQVPWDTVNILLIPVAYTGMLGMAIAKFTGNTIRAWIGYFVELVLVITGAYIGYTSNCLSVILLIFLAMTFLVVWNRTPDEIYTIER